jgi:hypothetical protein
MPKNNKRLEMLGIASPIDESFIDFVRGDSDEITEQLANDIYHRINSQLLPVVIQDEDGYQRGNDKIENVEIYMHMSKEERRQKLNNYPNLFNILLRDLLNLKLAEDGLEAVSISMDANFGVENVKQLLEVTRGL